MALARGAARMNLCVVLSQQILAVVVPIGSAYHRVNVALSGRLIGEPNTGMMIKFDHQNWPLDPVVEWIFFTVTSNPTPPGTIQRGFHARQFGR